MAPTAHRRRSVHFVPGGNDKFLSKALDSGADTLVFDLEDSVPPEAKTGARQAVAHWLRDLATNAANSEQEWMVRINPLDTEWGRDDVATVVAAGVGSLMVPKVERLDQFDELAAVIADTDPDSAVTFFPVATETPTAVFNLHHTVSHPRIDGICWGAEDLSAEIGADRTRNPDGSWLPVFDTVRSFTILAAAAADVAAVDAPYTDLGNLDGLRAETEQSAAMGFTGRLTIHPAQIEVVNEVFTPSAAEVEQATELVEAFAAAATEGRYAFRWQGQMVDVPHLNRARRLLKRAGTAPHDTPTEPGVTAAGERGRMP